MTRHFTVSLFHLSPFNKLSGAHAHTSLISRHINDLVRSPGTVTEGEDAASAQTQAGKRVKMSTGQNEMKGRGGASRGLVKIRVQTFHDAIILSPPSLEPPSFPRKDRDRFFPHLRAHGGSSAVQSELMICFTDSLTDYAAL